MIVSERDATASATTAFSNVVALAPRLRSQPLPIRLGQHATLFAQDRRREDDVFWLKENAEFLNIVHATGQPADQILAAYQAVYDTIDQRLSDYPQYYRFLLSICLDIEDLGMPGNKGAALCAWAHKQGLPDAELSDLQRSEAERLLARRDVGQRDDRLRTRLHRFLSRGETFAIPNKKAAYELTHIVFYLSEYGARDPGLGAAAIDSLNYAGLLAYLDQNYDLLAEVCVALYYAGQTPSPIWQGAVFAALKSAQTETTQSVAVNDDYHAYLVTNWMAGVAGRDAFSITLDAGPLRFDLAPPPARPLRQLGAAITTQRCAVWDQMRDAVMVQLDDEGRFLLDAAEKSTAKFPEFFERFARVSEPLAG